MMTEIVEEKHRNQLKYLKVKTWTTEDVQKVVIKVVYPMSSAL